MKYLLLIALVAVIVWAVRRPKAIPAARTRGQETGSAKMVPCAHCGVFLPIEESIGDGEQRYCCEAHRQAGSDRRKG